MGMEAWACVGWVWMADECLTVLTAPLVRKRFETQSDGQCPLSLNGAVLLPACVLVRSVAVTCRAETAG